MSIIFRGCFRKPSAVPNAVYAVKEGGPAQNRPEEQDLGTSLPSQDKEGEVQRRKLLSSAFVFQLEGALKCTIAFEGSLALEALRSNPAWRQLELVPAADAAAFKGNQTHEPV
eukprot:CAMPEP_0206382568 /NCGR_PEP_ID=MMETSP0294-20121207/13360_1 /ASSEMBLY_ACC=CAM_ASM_000327 /TAXON_ID=39354 /ORGANISM="Heterosigma akashiwo, Strain CCMP2393" /LENGTH=112 /DNA_ID=CAMNT_0053832319 /DNA_START=306 /DNA_END=641 /DNA_ORIENTATION=+